MIVELLAITALMIGGCTTARLAGIRGAAVPAIGLLAGVGIAVAVGTVQALLDWTHPVVTLLLTALVPIGTRFLFRARRGDVPLGLGTTAVTVGALVPVVAVLRTVPMVNLSTDSYAYATVGSLLAQGKLEVASPQLLQARVLAVPILHAPASLQGEFYLRSLTPLVALATLWLLGWLCREALRASQPRGAVTTLLPAAAVVVVATNNRFVFHAFYLNGHMLVGGLLLLFAAGAWLLARESSGGLDSPGAFDGTWVLSAVALPALVVARPEGFLLAGLALLPVLCVRRLPTVAGPVLLTVLGASVLTWHAILAVRFGAEGAVPVTVLGPAVLGAGLVLVAGALLRLQRWQVVPAWVLVLVELGLWMALAAAWITDPEPLHTSLAATWDNLAGGAGGWGVSLLVLAALVALALVLLRDEAGAILRFPVTTFVPLGLLLVYLREGAYRVGPGDSLNRMWMHVLPLAVLLVAVIAGQRRPDEPSQP